MTLIECLVQYRGPFTPEWQTLGSYRMWDNGNVMAEDKVTRDKLLAEADKKVGYIRVIEKEPRVLFGRPTAMTKKPASDDCHTYS